MKKKLFLICPNSKVEHFIREKYGEGCYFLTALGAVFKLKEQAYVEELINFIQREAIEEVIVLGDTSCFFIQNIITGQKGFDTHAERVLIDLLLDHYAYIMGSTSVVEQKARLAELNVQRQIEELLENDYFLQQVVFQKIKIKGLITSKAEGKVRAMDLYAGALSI